MYKVYLSPSTQDKSFGISNFGTEEFRMNQIADIVEQELIEHGDVAVFRNVPGMSKQEIIKDSNDVNPTIHVAIHTNYGNKVGPECYIKEGSEISNGFGKEVYNKLIKVYYDKSIDNGLIYDAKIIEINEVESPAILVMVGCHDNLNDVNWIIENIKPIGVSIADGIKKGFTLKVC